MIVNSLGDLFTQSGLLARGGAVEAAQIALLELVLQGLKELREVTRNGEK